MMICPWFQGCFPLQSIALSFGHIAAGIHRLVALYLVQKAAQKYLIKVSIKKYSKYTFLVYLVCHLVFDFHTIYDTVSSGVIVVMTDNLE